ncbi:MAG: FMN-binding protein [Planctomycetota bacterium]|nr:MAG: FMN-binding protein [Planctomycetota bacterium]
MKKFVDESWLVLVMGVLFAVLLAGAQGLLSGKIHENQQRALNDAIRAVAPDAERVERITIDGYDLGVFECRDADGRLSGWALEAAGAGFIDRIRLVVGVDATAEKITGVKVIEDLETPGLGNKIRRDEWAGQYKGLDATKAVRVEKRPPKSGENEIQAITGATWSSRYVTDIVNDVLARLRPELLKRRAAP